MHRSSLFSSLPSSVFIRSESTKLECEQHEGRLVLFNACAFVAGGPEPQEGGGLGQAQTSWSKGASGTIAPMKRRRAWRGQWPRKSSFASFWLIVFTCHSLLANKNGVFFKFIKRFCQVFTPNTKQVSCSG